MLNERSAGRKLDLQQQRLLRNNHWHWYQAVQKRGRVEPIELREDVIHGQAVIVQIMPPCVPENPDPLSMQSIHMNTEERLRRSAVPYGASIFTRVI
jgi:hypothetical protein